jgi:hypothetical protein
MKDEDEILSSCKTPLETFSNKFMFLVLPFISPWAQIETSTPQQHLDVGPML